MSLPITPSVNAISSGFESMKNNAEKIASTSAKGGEDTDDLAKAMVDLNFDRQQIEASVKVVQAVDEMLGTLLDITA